MNKRNLKPPRIAEWLLHKFTDSKFGHAVTGDFEEEYNEIVVRESRTRAKIWYWRTLFKAIPSIMKDRFYRSNMMLKNYIKVAMRNIIKQKGYTFINLAGLAVGMASCLLILLWIQDELSYDKFLKNNENLYRINFAEEINGSYDKYAKSPFAAPPVFAEKIPEVENYTIFYPENGVLNFQDNAFEKRVIYVNDTFFDLFSLDFIKGDASLLTEPGSIILTQETSTQIFGSEDPIGKILDLDGKYTLTVKGVLKNIPQNSHMEFTCLIPVSTLQGNDRNILSSWGMISGWSYVKLIDGADPAVIEEKMLQVATETQDAYTLDENYRMEFLLQNVADIHLRTQFWGNIKPKGDINSIYLFSLIVGFILVIACINFINLSTARSSKRSMEIGLRKVFGAYRNNVIFQFLSESVLVSLFGMVLALVLVKLALPEFNAFVGKELTLNIADNLLFAVEAIALIITVGVLAGSIPALSFSAFKPIECLKDKLGVMSGNTSLRNVLVVVQFAISTILIISTFTIIQQVDFMKNSSLGFDKEQIMALRLRNNTELPILKSIKEELSQYPDIVNVENSSGIPGRIHHTFSMVKIIEGQEVNHNIDVIMAGMDLIKTYKVEMLHGSDFNESNVSDTSRWSYILNEAAAKKFKMTENSIGEELGFSPENMGTTVGIMKDFHYSSLKSEIEPLVIAYSNGNNNYLSIKLNTKNLANTIDNIEKTWIKLNSAREFDYFFVDEHFDSLYKTEDRLNKITSIFAGIAIFIACLGLYGLASFTAEQKTKEISIRKVLGSSVSNIVLLLSKSFIKLIIISNLIAWPIVYYMMDKYLSEYAYRIDLGVELFLVPLAATLLIAFISVGYQTLKSSLSNPVDALKYE